MSQRLRLVILVLVLASVVLALWKWWPDAPDAPPPEAIDRDEVPEPLPPRLEGLPALPPEPAPLPVAVPPAETSPSRLPLEPYTVEGRVLDDATKKGVPYARLVVGWHTYDFEAHQEGTWTLDVEADRDGIFEVRIQDEFTRHANLFEMADGTNRRVYRWHVEGKEEVQIVPDPEVSEGEATRIVVWTRPVFRLQGVVVDEGGTPIPQVSLQFSVPRARGNSTMIGSGWLQTDENGLFDMGPFDEDPMAGLTEAQQKHQERFLLVTAQKDDWATLRFDPREIPEEERDRARITMTRGVTLAGAFVDDRGRPIPNAVIAVEYGKNYELRRGTRTDAEGRWRLETVTPAPLVLRARSFVADARFEREMTPTADDEAMHLVAERIRLSSDPVTYPALGLELVEVDDEIREAYGVPEYVHVLIWGTGEDPEALGIGKLEKGYGLWIVGTKRITSLAEAVEEFLAQLEGSGATPAPLRQRKRVVYTFWNERMSGTNTQYIPLTEERIQSLEDLRERLKR